MSKTLSEELCEICGIEPKLKEDAIQLYDEYYKKFADKILPDFTKPENLVKLLEIMTDTNNITEKVLLQTIEILSTESELGLLVCVKKQAIREANWDWS